MTVLKAGRQLDGGKFDEKLQNMSPARLYQQFFQEGTDWELIRFFPPVVGLALFFVPHILINFQPEWFCFSKNLLDQETISRITKLEAKVLIWLKSRNEWRRVFMRRKCWKAKEGINYMTDSEPSERVQGWSPDSRVPQKVRLIPISYSLITPPSFSPQTLTPYAASFLGPLAFHTILTRTWEKSNLNFWTFDNVQRSSPSHWFIPYSPASESLTRTSQKLQDIWTLSKPYVMISISLFEISH